jgi:hypothetical protein
MFSFFKRKEIIREKDFKDLKSLLKQKFYKMRWSKFRYSECDILFGEVKTSEKKLFILIYRSIK